MTSPNPITGTTPTDSGSSSSAPSNTLGPNSFITLLTAQLQAQDPLSPMDPDQMVNELTSINSLQQLVQITADMNILVGAVPGQGTGTTSSGSASNATIAQNSVVPTAAKLNYVVNSQINSQLNANSQSF